ncbi:AAA family ATPase [Acinetobacter baumannii]
MTDITKQLILTIGAPGSGKSTWAQEQAKKSRKGSRIIVLNRDDLRSMMFGGHYKYSRENENIVMDSVINSLYTALRDKDTTKVIIADTNLNLQTRLTYESIARDVMKETGFKIEVVEEPFDVDWVELEKRNAVRGNKAVPKPVLRSMHLNMQKYLGKHYQYVADKSKPQAVIFDLDGTLANNDHRDAFAYWKLIDDKPIEFVVNILKLYEEMGYHIICVSGRNAGTKEDHHKWEKLTQSWLAKHNIPYNELHMRAHDDRRKDDIVKEEIFRTHIAHKYNVECAYDDRDRVVEMWRRIGVNCCQVNFGEF